MAKMEEKKLLKSMIKERDKKILLLHQKRKDDEEYFGTIKSQITDIEHVLADGESSHEKVVAELNVEQAKAEDAMKKLEQEMSESGSLHEYAKLIKDAAGSSEVGTTYVLRLQSQLMKSMHSMGMLDNQMKLLKKYSNAMVKSLKDEISSAIDGKCKSEVDLMNDLAQLDGEKHEMEGGYEQKVEERRAAVAELEERLGCSADEEDEQDETTSENGSQEEEGEDDVALDIEIEGLRNQLETMMAEKESMEQHLKLAIGEKDAVLSRLKEETRRQEEVMKRYEEKEKRGRRAPATIKENSAHMIKEHRTCDDSEGVDEGSNGTNDAKGGGTETKLEPPKKCFSDDETSDTLSSGYSDR